MAHDLVGQGGFVALLPHHLLGLEDLHEILVVGNGFHFRDIFYLFSERTLVLWLANKSDESEYVKAHRSSQ